MTLLRLASGAEECDADTLSRLAELSLVELDVNPTIPTYHRSVRIADRVLNLVRGRLGLDREISRFTRVGGYIKNAVLRAAYLAADDGTAITEQHMWRAAHAEYEGMGKVTQRVTSSSSL